MIIETTFTCLFCHHDKSVTVKLDRKEGLALLHCRVCGQRYQGKVNRTCYWLPCPFLIIDSFADLTEPIDIYSEWIDAADAAQRDAGGAFSRRAAPSTSHSAIAANDASDED